MSAGAMSRRHTEAFIEAQGRGLAQIAWPENPERANPKISISH
jgi:hypothetical protein